MAAWRTREWSRDGSALARWSRLFVITEVTGGWPVLRLTSSLVICAVYGICTIRQRHHWSNASRHRLEAQSYSAYQLRKEVLGVCSWFLVHPASKTHWVTRFLQLLLSSAASSTSSQLMPIFLRSFLTTSFQFCHGASSWNPRVPMWELVAEVYGDPFVKDVQAISDVCIW